MDKLAHVVYSSVSGLKWKSQQEFLTFEFIEAFSNRNASWDFWGEENCVGNPETSVSLLHLLLDALQSAAEPLKHNLGSLLTKHPAGGGGEVDLVHGEVAENASCGSCYDGLLPAGQTLQQSCHRCLKAKRWNVLMLLEYDQLDINLSFLGGYVAVHHSRRIRGKPAIPEQERMWYKM